MAYSNVSKICPNCQTALISVDKKYGYYYYCPTEGCLYDCFESTKDCCNDPYLKATTYYKDETDAYIYNDNFDIYNQCQNCGRKVGSALKKVQNIPLFDRDLLEKYHKEREDLAKELKEIKAQKSQLKTDKFWDDYEAYLESDKWKQIRDIVLKRDNHLCQSCLTEPATQVHHTSGKFRKNEPIFSLVSVCDRCHSIITKIERGEHKTAEKICYSFDIKNKK